MVTEFAGEDPYEQSIRQLATEYLSVLGLAGRIKGRDLEHEDWLRLFKLAWSVIVCASHTAPMTPGDSVRIDSVLGEPDAAGWITTATAAQPPYWIPKADLSKLWALESVVNDFARQGYLARWRN